MIYKQCGYFTTCSFLSVSSSSIECQQSGCFCEDSKIHYNGSCSDIDICGENGMVIYFLFWEKISVYYCLTYNNVVYIYILSKAFIKYYCFA